MVIDEAENRLHVQKAMMAATDRAKRRTSSIVDDQLRLDLLREALPYIQRFKGQTFVVKLSGKVTEDQENLTRSPKNWRCCIRSAFASALFMVAANN